MEKLTPKKNLIFVSKCEIQIHTTHCFAPQIMDFFFHFYIKNTKSLCQGSIIVFQERERDTPIWKFWLILILNIHILLFWLITNSYRCIFHYPLDTLRKTTTPPCFSALVKLFQIVPCITISVSWPNKHHMNVLLFPSRKVATRWKYQPLFIYCNGTNFLKMTNIEQCQCYIVLKYCRNIFTFLHSYRFIQIYVVTLSGVCSACVPCEPLFTGTNAVKHLWLFCVCKHKEAKLILCVLKTTL